MRDVESIIEELENCFQGHDEYILGLLGDLKDYLSMKEQGEFININNWLKFEDNFCKGLQRPIEEWKACLFSEDLW